MQGFVQTPDPNPNPNHTVGWATLRSLDYEEIAVRNDGFGKNCCQKCIRLCRPTTYDRKINLGGI